MDRGVWWRGKKNINTKSGKVERLNLESVKTNKPSSHILLLFTIFAFPMIIKWHSPFTHFSLSLSQILKLLEAVRHTLLITRAQLGLLWFVLICESLSISMGFFFVNKWMVFLCERYSSIGLFSSINFVHIVSITFGWC